MGENYITDTRQISNLKTEIKAKIDDAVLAAAYKIRDVMRSKFVQSKGIYKKTTSKYDYLKEGIKLGHFERGTIKIHALGDKQIYNSFKTRFFVGGTAPRYRETYKKSSGYIKANNAVDLHSIGGENILTTFINNAINEK